MRISNAIVVLMVLLGPVKLLAIQSEMTLIDEKTGREFTVTEEISPGSSTDFLWFTHHKVEGGLIWEASASWAICKSVGISDSTYHSFIGWHTNDQAWAFFNDIVHVPIWEYDLGNPDYLPQAITPDGATLVGGMGNTIYGFGPSSNIPLWLYSISMPSDEVYELLLSHNAEVIYFVSGDAYDHLNITSISPEPFGGGFEENWSYALPENGAGWSSALSGNGERLVVSQYYWVTVYSRTGDVLFQIERDTGSQTTPAISDDGSIFVLGDFHGNVDVYEYDLDTSTYELKWQYQFDPSGNYDWVTALAISEDGSTVAAGSFQNDGQAQYSGELAVFDIDNNVPLWIYYTEDDMIRGADISADGSVIAAIGLGPLADGGDDFWIFGKDNNTPFLTYDCIGSPLDLDLSSDGARCIVGGKAVHARTMGHGGRLYCFEANQLSSVDGSGSDVPSTFALLQNYPNPFNPQTNFAYFLTEPGHVRLAIYDLQGRLVATVVDDFGLQGSGSVFWSGRDDSSEAVASGVYFARLEAGGNLDTIKITLTK